MVAFLLEVGTEELPPSFIGDALAQWQQRLPESLRAEGLWLEGDSPTRLQVFGTPRRLALLLEGLPERQPDRAIEAKGPALAAAFANGDPRGEPTKAALGFARSRGVDVADLVVRETEKGAFVFAVQRLAGRPTRDILTELAPTWVTGLEGKRLMRWGSGDLKFPRPIRWLVALLDGEVLPLELEGLPADRHSMGHRVLHPRIVVIDTASDYAATLKEAFVLVDVAARQQRILTQIRGVTELMGAKAKIPSHLLEEVTQLVEWPTAVVGEFDREFLSLPADAIEMEMIEHQRYFPVYSADDPGELLPYFITISNGDPEKSGQIALGNGRVIRARLADGKFFYEVDRAKPLASYVPLLQQVTFQETLGSVGQKVQRIRAIAAATVAAIANLDPDAETIAHIDRTAYLCKADLVTQMVKEFPELQGVMGRYYAEASGESPAVALGILEHYLPKGAGDALPQTLPGKIVAIADRIDTLVGIFGVGNLPTGSSDPFALRRAAAGVLQIAWDSQFALNLPALLQGAIATYTKQLQLPVPTDTLLSHLYDWFEQRARTLLQDRGIDYDLVDGLFGVDDRPYALTALADLSRLRARADFLQHIRRNGTLEGMYEVVNRASRLAVQGTLPDGAVDARTAIAQDALVDPAERALYEAIVALPAQADDATRARAIANLAPTLTQFFEAVLVMHEDERIRQNRLNLLGILRNYSRVLADFSAIRAA